MNTKSKIFITFLVSSITVVSGLSNRVAAKQSAPTPETVLKTLKKEHPRLVLTEARLAELKRQLPQDKLLQKIRDDVIKRADGYLKRNPVVYKVVGPRLLSVSRDCLSRVYACGLAYRLTGEKKYADKVLAEMLSVCDFKDWNPSHFLDTAEMSHAVGVGYDWLYNDLDETMRKRIRAGLIKNGMEPGLKGYFAKKPAWWWRSEYNWNQVCNSGLLIGALAIAEDEPQTAAKIVAKAVEGLPFAIKTYRPNGAWPESVGYWNYATSYTVYGLAALNSALGTDFGISNDPGLAKTGEFPIYAAGPTDYFVNFADVGGNSRRRTLPPLLWLGHRYGRDDFIASEMQMVQKHSASPHHFIWFQTSKNPDPKFDLDRLFKGLSEVTVMRSSWDDRDALFVSLKGGSNSINHGHLDMGTFEIHALGERWAIDLGADNYNLSGYWDKREGGRRWNYYRLGSFSHNLPIINGHHQKVNAVGHIVKFQNKPNFASATIDMTEAYPDTMKKITRRVELIDKRRAIVIRDEFEPKTKSQIAWGMTTAAQIKTKGTSAILSQKGKQLKAQLLSPPGAVFSVESAEQKPPQKTNQGVRRLMVHLKDQTKPVTLEIKFTP
jgi:heparinase II/III-like protein